MDTSNLSKSEVAENYLSILMNKVRNGELQYFEVDIDNNIMRLAPLPGEQWAEYQEKGNTYWHLAFSFVDKDKEDKYFAEVKRRQLGFSRKHIN